MEAQVFNEQRIRELSDEGAARMARVKSIENAHFFRKNEHKYSFTCIKIIMIEIFLKEEGI